MDGAGVMVRGVVTGGVAADSSAVGDCARDRKYVGHGCTREDARQRRSRQQHGTWQTASGVATDSAAVDGSDTQEFLWLYYCTCTSSIGDDLEGRKIMFK